MWAWACCGAASAAEVRTDAGCYSEGADVRMTASGFAPGAGFAALLDGVQLGGGLVEQAGRVEAAVPAPALRDGVHEQRHAVGVLDAAGAAAATTFRVSRVAASISPAAPRDARTARVRFRVYGMGSGRTVTMRWIDPAGRVARRASLGRAEAPCGRLTTARRRLFPFTPRPGVWRVRFSAGTAQVVLRVRVFRSP